MSLHANAVRVGLRAAGRMAGGSVTYRRASTIIPLSGAIQGSSNFQIEDSDGFEISVSSADFIFSVDQLAHLDLPKRGDIIARTYGTESERFEVLPFGKDERVYSWVDRARTHIRVHVKEIR